MARILAGKPTQRIKTPVNVWDDWEESEPELEQKNNPRRLRWRTVRYPRRNMRT